MNRITEKTKDGGIFQPVYTATTMAFLKLSQYEDTGLEPNEVQDLKNGIIPSGEWVMYKDDSGNKRYKCSRCDVTVARNSQKSRFCPSCGARLNED